MTRSMWRPLALLGLVFGAPHLVSAQQVWGQGGLGAVFVGLDGERQAIYRKYYLVAVGPEADELKDDYEVVHRCARDSVVSLVRNNPKLWTTFSKIPTRSEALLAVAKARREIDSRVMDDFRHDSSQAIQEAFASLRASYFERLQSCSGFPRLRVASVRFGVVRRICTKSTCRSTSELRPDAGEEGSGRYEKLDEFIRQAGFRPVNEALEIAVDGSLSDLPFRKDSGNSDANDGRDDTWPAEPAVEEAQQTLERGVVLLRKWGAKYASSAPMAAGVSQQTARRILDVIDHPAIAIPQLRLRESSGKDLLLIADDIAQSRIRQCINFQAKRTAAEIGACAGYKLDEPLLAGCLSKKFCVPAFEEDAWINAAEVVVPTTLKGLADTSIARILPASNTNWEQYRAVAQTCAKNSPDATEATLCLTRASVPADSMTMFDCATGAAKKGKLGQANGTRCLLDNLTDVQIRTIGGCIDSATGNMERLVECSVLGATGGDGKAISTCVQQARSSNVVDPMGCFAAVGGQGAAILSSCRSENEGDVAAISVCYFEKKGNLPKGSSAAMRCAESSSVSVSGFAECLGNQLLVDQIPGEAGRAIRCAAQSGGSTVGTLACVAGPKVRPEQQVALECLGQSAEAMSYAICVGGRLTLNELQNCQRIEYGESGCYGENNEIRKFLGALQINTDKGTVMGDLIAFHVKVAVTELVVAETGLKTAGKAGKDALRFAEQLGSGVAGAVHSAGGTFGDFVNGAMGEVMGFLDETLGGIL